MNFNINLILLVCNPGLSTKLRALGKLLLSTPLHVCIYDIELIERAVQDGALKLHNYLHLLQNLHNFWLLCSISIKIDPN